MKNAILLLFGFILHTQLQAGIYCPPDITIDCTDDIHNTDITGVATPGGPYAWMTPVYEDWGSIGNCSSGTITRKWYVDLNWNNHLDPSEPFCKQFITVLHDSEDVQITWPDDVHLNCADDVPPSAPWIAHGPCDMIGWSYEDQFFDISSGVCEKILRHFTVINWCTYTPGGSQGIWTYTQKIFFEDSEPPTIDVCEDITLSTTDCKGTFTVSNAASDTGFCTSESIRWIIHVDLGSNGSIDYTYGSNESGNFYIPPTSNGEEVEITLPVQVGIGWHNVTWKIYDGCGNVDYCSQMVTMKDLTPPTPICYTNLSTVLMPASGMVELNVNTMVKEGYDNCSWPEWIDFSFTPEPGTETMIFDCTNEGVEMIKVYAIDHYGNYNFCKVMILFQDNGDYCPDQLAYTGNVMNARGEGIADVELQFLEASGDMRDQTISNAAGSFEFADTHLSESLDLQAYKMDGSSDLTVLDILMFKKHLFGEIELNNTAKFLADIDGDGNLSAFDLLALRDMIIFQEEHPLVFSSWSSSKAEYEFQDTWSLREASEIDNYYGFTMGNISENYAKEAILNKTVEPRSKAELSFVKEGNLTHIYLKDETCLNGLQLRLNATGNGSWLSGQLSVSEITAQDNGSDHTMIWSSDDCRIMNTVDPILSFSSEVSQDFELIGTNVLVKDNEDKELFIDDLRNKPIPASQDIRVTMMASDLQILTNTESRYHVNITDLQGRTLSQFKNLTGDQLMPLQIQESGIYLVVLENAEDHTIHTQKVFLK